MMERLQNIPEELKQYNQWVCWKYEDRGEGKPTKLPYNPNNGTLANVNESYTWSSFDIAKLALKTYDYSGIGFILTDNDPFAFIDLDDAKSDEERLLQSQIFDNFESYSEISPSGSGLHIICKGSLPKGKRKQSVELYTNQRYMTVTGDVYRNEPIKDYQSILYSLWEHLGGIDYSTPQHKFEVTSMVTDAVIIDRAAHADNGELFRDLYMGNWQNHSHKWSDGSQSCADQALINIIQFYTKDTRQIKRIFRSSALGQRDKAQRDNYLNTCIRKAGDRDLPLVDTASLIDGITKAIDVANNQRQFPCIEKKPNDVYMADEDELMLHPKQSVFTIPPGMVGRIARFIHDSAPRPVPEIALGASIALMAGMCGRSYNISGTGLNQYVLILAQTGVGKEAAGSGVNVLLNEVKKSIPTVTDFIGPSVIASPQGLIKRLSKSKSFVSIIGEFGLKLQEMTSRNASASAKGVQTAFLDLFNKSGFGESFGAMAYSDNEKNVESLLSPAFSLLGESTPGAFYEAIDEKSVRSGLIPRFTIIEYFGDRPHINEHRAKVHDNLDLVADLAKVAAQCQMLNSQNKVINVELDNESELLFKEYNLFVDGQIRGRDDVIRHVWNRAHIKALKLAGLLSVGMNPYNPIVTKDLADWSINIENANIKRLLLKFQNGEVGEKAQYGENVQLLKINEVIKQWLVCSWRELEGYRCGNQIMHNDKVIPYKFLQQRLTPNISFREDKLGATNAIKRCLKIMEDSGDIIGTKDKFKYNSSSLVYAILNPSHFL
jgi:hypothetical protein